MIPGTILTFVAPDAKGFQQPSLARVIFWHLPCALVCAVAIFAASYFSFRYLKTRRAEWDVRAVAANELGVVTGILTLVTGMLFAEVQWGVYWNWDPRQTSFLFVMLFVGAYFALRAAFDDPAKRSANAAAYSVASLLPMLFLLFVYPKLPMVVSLHPNLLQQGGGFDPSYRRVFVVMFLLVGALCVTIYRLRVRAGLMDLALEESYAELANRDYPAAPRVVRPVPVPEPGGEESPGSRIPD